MGIFQAQVDDERYVQAIQSVDDRFEYYWLYWMAGSSGCGLLLCVFGSLAIVMLIKACKSSNAGDRNEPAGDENGPDGGQEMRNLSSSEKEDREGETRNEEILLVEGESLIAFKEPLLEPLTCSAMTTLFVSNFFFNAAILCCMFFHCQHAK